MISTIFDLNIFSACASSSTTAVSAPLPVLKLFLEKSNDIFCYWTGKGGTSNE